MNACDRRIRGFSGRLRFAVPATYAAGNSCVGLRPETVAGENGLA
ncbi:hypothetical protein [Rosistilla oblonga]